jgi:hypothetical protein
VPHAVRPDPEPKPSIWLSTFKKPRSTLDATNACSADLSVAIFDNSGTERSFREGNFHAIAASNERETGELVRALEGHTDVGTDLRYNRDGTALGKHPVRCTVRDAYGAREHQL